MDGGESPDLDRPDHPQQQVQRSSSEEKDALISDQGETLGDENDKIPTDMEAYFEHLDQALLSCSLLSRHLYSLCSRPASHLQVSLSQVSISAPKRGETFGHRIWRHCFNMLRKLNLLALMRRSGIYNNTTEALLRSGSAHRIVAVPED